MYMYMWSDLLFDTVVVSRVRDRRARRSSSSFAEWAVVWNPSGMMWTVEQSDTFSLHSRARTTKSKLGRVNSDGMIE